jgi:hypothetical protein
MASARQRQRRRLVEAVRTRMAVRQKAILGVLALSQLGVTRIDLHDDPDYGAVTLIPSQPPPLVASMRRGNERDVAAVVTGHQLTNEATTGRVSVIGDRAPRPQVGAAHGGVCSATRPHGPHPDELGDRPITDSRIPA